MHGTDEKGIRILLGKHDGKEHSEDLDADERILPTSNLNKHDMDLSTRFIYHRI
jgi:hypothetical protein